MNVNSRNRENTYKLLLVLFVMISKYYTVQGKMLDSINYVKYNFINKELNIIENDSNSLCLFYEKLYRLQKTEEGRVNITHIGDSHLQADHFSGAIRQKMQLMFGNAGRGFIYPYNVAKSNEPHTYTTRTKTIWDAKRNVFHLKPLPIGIGGFTIETGDSCSTINLTVEDQKGLGYSFTKFTLFQERELNNYDISICDSLNRQLGVFKFLDKSESLFTSEIRFKKPMCHININSQVSDTANQKLTRIYGMLLENDSSGVLYNMIGVNGAKCKHYNKSKYFIEQLSYLKSDLFIVSLGTNEAYYSDFNQANFYKNLDTLISNITSTNPSANVILTTPPDSYHRTRNGNVKNATMKKARLAIINYSLHHNLPYWDLYEIMGGYGSMYKWYINHLSVKDRVHFNSKGYSIQAELFYIALMDGYERFKQKRKLSTPYSNIGCGL